MCAAPTSALMRMVSPAENYRSISPAKEQPCARETIHLQDDTGRKKTLEDEIKTWLPAGATFEVTKFDNWDKTDTPLHVEGTVKLSAFGSAVGRRILVPATIFVVPENKAFQTAIRHNAVYFRYPNEEIDDIKFQGPAGYKVETVPPAKMLKPGAVVGYEISASQQGSVAEVKRKLVINGLHVPGRVLRVLTLFLQHGEIQ